MTSISAGSDGLRAQQRSLSLCMSFQPARLLYCQLPGHAPNSLLRLIEVKGKTTEWDNDELVTLSHRQFTDALSHDTEAAGWDYWLYVVQQVEEGQFEMLLIKKPAQQAQRFGFRGGIWRVMAEEHYKQGSDT